MTISRSNMAQQVEKPPMKKSDKSTFKRGGKVKAGKSGKSGKVDQMQSSPRKQMAMKGMK